MGIIQKIRKDKEVIKIKLNNGLKDLKNFDFESVIPNNATQIEFKFIEREKILIIDYIINLEIKDYIIN